MQAVGVTDTGRCSGTFDLVIYFKASNYNILPVGCKDSRITLTSSSSTAQDDVIDPVGMVFH